MICVPPGTINSRNHSLCSSFSEIVQKFVRTEKEDITQVERGKSFQIIIHKELVTVVSLLLFIFYF
jgi:hypothetical protein